jgi:hypothetical protein
MKGLKLKFMYSTAVKSTFIIYKLQTAKDFYVKKRDILAD